MIINSHCHLFNFRFIPDSFFKIWSPIPERLLRHVFTRWLVRLITFLWPSKKYDRTHELISILDKEIDQVARRLVGEMKEAGIDMSTPLMMDLEIASFRVIPEIPYRWQVKLVSDVASSYPGVLMPFVMFDPRRMDSVRLVIKALEDLGFLGLKIYPPLGYHPDPRSFFNDNGANKALAEIYEYCETNAIPVTAHCSRVAAYSGDFMRSKELVIDFCQPGNWTAVLKRYPKLHLNLAHFGGDEEFLKIDNPISWANVIIEFMRECDNVYADISFHNVALETRTSENYFTILKRLIDDQVVGHRILFGTDWPMARHTWKEDSYTKAFNSLPPVALNRIAFDNPLNFLFPDNKLPPRIRRFYESRGVSTVDLPKWMQEYLQV